MGQYRKLLVAATRVAAASTLAAAALIAVPAYGTPSNNFNGTLQWSGPFSDIDVKTKTGTLDMKYTTKGDSVLVVTRFAIPAGGTSGWHSHPGFSLVTVTLGAVTLYDAALCTPRVLVAGQTFVDEGGGHVHLVRNESGADAAVAAVQMVTTGPAAGRRIDAPRPNNCAPGIE